MRNFPCPPTTFFIPFMDYYQPVDYNGQPAYEVVDVEGGS
jgi:hypothetical protein